MANLSGTIPLTVSSTNSITGWITWNETSVDVIHNTSTVTANLTFKCSGPDTTSWESSNFYIEINGNRTQYEDAFSIAPGETKSVWAQGVIPTQSIIHAADGSKTITISGGGGMSATTGLKTSSGSASVSLSLIPRASEFGTITGNTIGSAISIGISPKISGTFYHRVTWTFGSKSGSINGGQSETSVSWAATAAGGNTVANLAGEIPTSVSGTAALTLYTYSDSARTKQVGTPATKNWTISLPSSVKPTISSTTAEETVALVNSTLGVSATRDNNYVQLVSKPQFTVSASGGTGTTTSLTYQITFGGTTKTATSTTGSSNQTFGAIVGNGAQAATITVIDSRGRSTQTTHAIAVLAYEQPTLSRVSALRSSTTPTTVNYKVTTKGGSLTIGAEEKNSLTVTITGGPSTKTETISDYSETTTPISHTGYDVSQSYAVSVALNDAFFTVTQSNIRVPTASVIMDIRTNGKVGIGKYLENGALDVNGAIYASGSVFSNAAFFTGGKASVSDGAMGAALGRYGVLYLQGNSSYNPGITFLGKTGSTTLTSRISEPSDGNLKIEASAGLDLQSLNYAPSSATTYNIPFSSATSAADGQYTSYINGGLRYRTREGTVGTDGLAMLYLGNNTGSGTAGNSYGALMLYGTGTNYVQLRTASTMTTSPTIYFPDKGGTIALTSDISSSGAFDSLWTGSFNSGSETLSASAANYDYLIVYGSNGANGTSYVTTVCVNGDSANLVWIQDAYISFTISGTSLAIDSASSGRYLRRVYGVKIG